MIRPQTGASVALFRNGRVLLVRRAKGAYRDLWSLPGGGQQAGETLEATARRELREETGLETGLLHFLEMHEPVLRDDAGEVRAHFVLAVFAGHAGEGEPVAGDDASAVRWADAGSLDDDDMTPHAAEIIARARALLGQD